MAERPEPQSQLEVENQCPTVTHDDVSRKHNPDLQSTSGKSWHFIANFNPEDISHHHSLEDYQRLFLTHDERIPLSYLVIQIISTSIVSDSMEWQIEGFVQLKNPKSRNMLEKYWMPGKTATRCEWIRIVGGLRGHKDFLNFSLRNLDPEVLTLELFGMLGANNAGRSINAEINSVNRARNVLSHYSKYSSSSTVIKYTCF